MNADDAALLRRHLGGDREAFAVLVRRHIDLVYAAALRRVGGDTHLAEDVTQAVFSGLARKAKALADRRVLSGWLYLSAQYQAAKLVRTEQRRRGREEKAQVMSEIERSAAAEPDWAELRPVLDRAMSELKEDDRDALLLRFFQARSLAEVGEALGLKENAARMRVDRALEKLRERLARQGVTSTAAVLGGGISAHMVQAAPAALATTVSSLAVTGAGAGGAATIFFMGMTKIQAGVAAAVVAAGGAAFVAQHDDKAALREEIDRLAAVPLKVAPSPAENPGRARAAEEAALLREQAAGLSELRRTVEELRAQESAAKVATEARRRAAREAQRNRTNADGQEELIPIRDLDTVPVFAKTNKSLAYPRELALVGVPAKVVVSFIVGEDGSVQDLTVASATNEIAAEAVAKGVAEWRFEPGRKDGKPVRSRLTMPIVLKPDLNEPDWF
jgi:RNA polymerase sigma factor (sigma-70 family)